jgi:cell division protein FtsB
VFGSRPTQKHLADLEPDSASKTRERENQEKFSGGLSRPRSENILFLLLIFFLAGFSYLARVDQIQGTRICPVGSQLSYFFVSPISCDEMQLKRYQLIQEVSLFRGDIFCLWADTLWFFPRAQR